MVLVQVSFLSERSTTGRHSGSLPQASNLVGGITTAAGVEPQKHSEHLLTTRFPPFSSHRICATGRRHQRLCFSAPPSCHSTSLLALCIRIAGASVASSCVEHRDLGESARDSRRATHLTILSLLSRSSTWPTQPCSRLSGGYGPIASLLAVPRSSQTSPRCPSAFSMSRALSMSLVRIHFSLPALHSSPLRMSFSAVLDQFGSVAIWSIGPA